MPATRGLPFGFSWFFRRGAVLLGAGSLVTGSLVTLGLGACTLITDIDREKIPQPETPVFPEIDAGPQPDPRSDAGTPDASVPPEEPTDAGSDAGDGGLDSGDAGDAAAPDAG